MNKIKQNKITFSLILIAISVVFSSLIILSLPVLFDYKSKVTKIEKNFYNNFKIYLKSSGDISYKPFPKPHFLVEKATLNLEKESKNHLIKTNNLKIFITLRDIYLGSLKNFVSMEIINTNLDFKLKNLRDFRDHLYKKINKPIKLIDCKIFVRNKNDEVIVISPINKIIYKINDKTKTKNFFIDGKIFGIDFKSTWKRNYELPNQSVTNAELFKPNIEIKNILNFKEKSQLDGELFIDYFQDKLKYEYSFFQKTIVIKTPNDNRYNFNLSSKIELSPFYFEGSLKINNKKLETVIDHILSNLLIYDENYLGNLSGIFNLKLQNINNKLIKDGELNFDIKQKKIKLDNAKFNLHKIGELNSKIDFVETGGDVIFISKNVLNIKDHIEFAKVFQIGSKNIKNIKKIYFDLNKNIGETDFTIYNVRINDTSNNKNSNLKFLIKNIQNLRASFRKVIY